jgi:hypothetical protein
MNRCFFRPLVILCPIVVGMAICAGQETPTTPATQPTTNPVALNWDQAKDHVGETATVTGPVVGTHSFKDGGFVLNVGKDFPDKDRLTIFVGEDQAAGQTPDSFDGKTVSATGKIELYHEVAEIRCGAKDIQTATTQPAATQP